MEKELNSVIEALEKIKGFAFIDASIKGDWIHFKMDSKASLNFLTKKLSEVKKQFSLELVVLGNKNKPEETTYQLVINSQDKIGTFESLVEKLSDRQKPQRPKKNKYEQLGIPDLSLVTLRQMANELKQRPNLTFALIWIDDHEIDNIAIEGAGNPTQIVGLLSRGTHLAIEWADKNIKFFKPEEDGEA